MRISLAIIACLSIFQAQPVSAYLFGDVPKSEAATELKNRILETYKSQGIAPAISLLDEEGLAFLKKSDAQAQCDFFDVLCAETKSGAGRDQQEWRMALTEWCYRYCVKVGDSYWSSVWTPLMHERYFEAGKYGAARVVIDRERTRLLEEGKELEVDKMKTVRPANPEFPLVELKTLGARERISSKQFTFFMSNAEQDLAEGRWKRAMEASTLAAADQMGNLKWYQQRPNLVDSKDNVRQMTGRWRQGLLNLADGYQFLDLAEPELATLRELEKFNNAEKFGRNLVLMAGCRAFHLEYVLGKNGPEVVAEMIKKQTALAAYTDILKDDSELLNLMIADVHFRQGDAKSGWTMIDELRANESLTRDSRFQVDSEWCRHRVDTGLTDEVETVLIDLLKIAREGGLKRREIGLYETYARLLVALGRYEDALVIQRELMRLLRSFDLFPRLPGALHYLAGIHALLGEKDRADASLKEANRILESSKIPDASKKRIREIVGRALPVPPADRDAKNQVADLQPVRAMMVPLKGLPARGLFTLTNPSGKAVSGKLRFRGAGLAFRDEEAGMIAVDISKAGGKTELTREVAIPAGDFFAIDLSRPAEDGEAKVSIIWEPVVGEAQTAEWVAESAEEGVSIAITDAAEYLDNPFYLIPVYHLLQYTDTFAQVADVRVVASAPARIELYDQNDELIFVDADGDGAFVSEGDIVSKDLNRNYYGDLKLDTKRQEMRFRLFVRPAEVVPGKELNLDLQLLQQGEWATHSTDRLLFPAKNQ